MKRTCCNTMTILLAGLLLAGPALGNGGPSVSDSGTSGDSSARPAIGQDSPSKLGTTGDGSLQPGVGKDSSAMSERKTPGYSGDSSVSSTSRQLKDSGIAATSMSVDQVRELQRLLGERGFSAGKTDGIIGPRTTAAIRQFQTANELTVNGTPDQATLRVLAPDAKKQEFFGLAPAYGEPEGVKEQPVKTEPMERMEQPIKNEPGKMMEQPMKKGY